MTQIDDYVPPSAGEGDRINPMELRDRVLLVQPLKIVHDVNTKHGVKDAISVNAADVDAGAVYRSALWFNGAIVDGLRGSVGKTLALRVVFTTSKAGNDYLTIEAVDADGKEKAAKWLSANPTAFAPAIDDPATGGDQEEPF